MIAYLATWLIIYLRVHVFVSWESSHPAENTKEYDIRGRSVMFLL